MQHCEHVSPACVVVASFIILSPCLSWGRAYADPPECCRILWLERVQGDSIKATTLFLRKLTADREDPHTQRPVFPVSLKNMLHKIKFIATVSATYTCCYLKKNVEALPLACPLAGTARKEERDVGESRGKGLKRQIFPLPSMTLNASMWVLLFF